MFCVKGYAGGQPAGRSFGYVVVVIVGSNTAATIAGAKPAGNSVAQQTFSIGGLRKGDWINGIVNGPIGHGGRKFPLWIRVPTRQALLAQCWRRYFSCRPTPQPAVSHHPAAE
jgi:hypothetical protein